MSRTDPTSTNQLLAKLKRVLDAIRTGGLSERRVAEQFPAAPLDLIDDLPSSTGWKHQYDEMRKDAEEVYGIVFSILTDPERPLDKDERIADAANEVHWAFKRSEARQLFIDGGLTQPASTGGDDA